MGDGRGRESDLLFCKTVSSSSTDWLVGWLVGRVYRWWVFAIIYRTIFKDAEDINGN